MLNPVRSSAGWIGGRLLLFAIIVLLLAFGPSRAALGGLVEDLKRLLPSSSLTAELNGVLAGAGAFEQQQRMALDVELQQLVGGIRMADARARAAVDARRRQVTDAIPPLEAKRLSPAAKLNALLTGKRLRSDVENEIAIALKRRELRELDRVLAIVDGRIDQTRDLTARADAAWQTTIAAYELYHRKHVEYEALKASRLVPAAWSAEGIRLRRDRDRLLAEYQEAYATYQARTRLADDARSVRTLIAQPLETVREETLAGLEEVIGNRARAAEAATALWEKCRRVLWTALLIVVGITLLPAFIRAFWYWVVAPWISRRAPIRLAAPPGPGVSRTGAAAVQADVAAAQARRRISAVSQEVVLAPGESLLIHPEFLQSSAAVGRKDTQWLLSWRFPLSSVASRMVALTRIREAPGHTFVISSKSDPLAEVGMIPVQQGASLVLQPRYLIGMIHRTGQPMHVRRRWRFGTSAWITFQFRYLLFDGPGTLIVQGCRGIRLEPADGRRSIDQQATIGFDAHLAYSPRRSETFSAYLFGIRGLFNDSFAGDGVFAYEEMPYAGRKAGITGRGLEGITDGLMKVMGI